MDRKVIAKESIIRLKDQTNKYVRVKFQGGREVTGVLKNSDFQLNMILDDCIETLRDKSDPYVMTKEKRRLGLIIVRGTLVTSIYPMDGAHEIDNPFLNVGENQDDDNGQQE